MNGNTLSLGTGTSTRGTLAYTAGKVYNGTFSRWYGTNNVASEKQYRALFPLGTRLNDRSMYIYTSSAPTTGGQIAVHHDENAAAAATDNDI